VQRIDLVSGALELSLAPAVGGGIARFDHRTPEGLVPILRRSPDTYDDVRQSAGYPLVPFSNRVRDGLFSFAGREIRLSPNRAGHPHPMHGQGWRGAWRVDHADETNAELVFTHSAGEWPWAYEARQRFELTPQALTVVVSCRNDSSDVMPCGLGLHPYFERSGPMVLETAAGSVWTVDADILPVERQPADGAYDLARRRIDGAGLDNGYEDWSGHARLTWQDRNLAVEISAPVSRLQVCALADGDFVAVEPVTHANAALNTPEATWAGQGIQLLNPGASMSLTVRIAVLEA
jgi:aldose 1-epimerase